MLSVSALVVNGTELDITTDGDEDITIQASTNPLTPGRLEVLVGSTERGIAQTNLRNLPVMQASALISITIDAGSDQNQIDFSQVSTINGFNAALKLIVNAGNGDDILIGSPDIANEFNGGDGKDTLFGGNSNDLLNGNDGADTIFGDIVLAGADPTTTVDPTPLTNDGHDIIAGGDGADIIQGVFGNDTIDSGDGNDIVNGGVGDDSVYADNGADSLFGNAGNDTLNSDGGTDFVSGGDGNDSILGGEFNDTLLGDAGSDTIDGQGGQDSVDGGLDGDSLIGGIGNDTLNGNDGNDTLNGNLGNDTLNGNAGNDRILGGGGNDVANGDADNDSLFGNGGNDTLNGGIGVDSLDGGDGNDLLRGNQPTLSINDVSVLEGNSGTTTAVFTITMSEANDAPVSVVYRTSDGTARLADGDYLQATPTRVTFQPGQTTQTVSVTVTGDVFDELDETFSVLLANPVNATIADGAGVGTILNGNDSTVLARVSDATVSEGNGAPAVTLDFTVTLAKASSGPVTLTYTTQDGSATAGTDYQQVTNGTLVIPSGFLTGIISIPVIGDRAVELDETLFLNLAATGNLQLLNAQAQGTIVDDDSSGGPGIWGIPNDGTNSAVLYDSRNFAEVRRLPLPAGVTIDANGGNGLAYIDQPALRALWVLDDTRDLLFRIDVVTGNLLPVFPGGPTQFDIGSTNNFTGLAVLEDPANANNELIYLLDRTANNVRVVDPGLLNAATPPVLVPFGLVGTIALPGAAEGNGFAAIDNPAGQLDQLVYFNDLSGLVFSARIIDVSGTNLRTVRIDRPNQGSIRSLGILPDAIGRAELYVGQDNGVVDIFPLIGNPAPPIRRVQAPVGIVEFGGEDSGSSLALPGNPPAQTPFTLSSGTGDGSVQVGVDGFGSFGNSVGGAALDASFDPLGATSATGSVSQSGLALRVGTNGTRQFLTSGSISGTGNLANPTVTGTSTSGQSQFTLGTLNFVLDQVMDPFFDTAGSQIGSVLTQTYSVTNRSLSTVDFELLRYLNGNLDPFDQVTPGEGGGHFLTPDGEEVLVEMATVGGLNSPSTLLGITATQSPPAGGSGSASDRFQFSPAIGGGGTVGLSQSIVNGSALTNAVTNDSADADEFVDSQEFTAAAAFRNVFNLGANGSATYVTRTFFVSGRPSDLTLPLATIENSPNTLVGGAGNDTIFAGNGDDNINGGAGDDSLNAGDGNDTVSGGAGRDTLDGGSGDDVLRGQGGDDIVIGGAGEDTFQWNAASDGNDTMVGTDGADELQVFGDGAANAINVGASGEELLISSGTNSAVTAPTINAVTIFGRGGNDTISVGDLSTTRQFLLTINGEAGDDLLYATGMNTGGIRMLLDGGAGNDSLVGGKGRDTLMGGDGNDRLLGGDNNDLLLGQAGHDSAEGQAGNDTVIGDTAADTIVGATGGGFDTLLGNDGNDLLLAGGGDDLLDGGIGADTIQGNDGADTLNGAAGNDVLLGGAGTDNISGGSGDDTLDGGRNDDSMSGNSGNDRILGDHGNDYLNGAEGNDTIVGGDGNDTVLGGLGDDAINGGDGADYINAGDGNDILVGGDGNDTLLAGAGSDIALGRDGDDVVNGQGGSTNILAGNEGNDLVVGTASEINEAFSLGSLGSALLNSLGITL